MLAAAGRRALSVHERRRVKPRRTSAVVGLGQILMRHAESTANTLEKLKAIGVRLAVDDFGTGYSSLSYLTRFPIDALKLDPWFIHDITASSDNAIVVSAVIGMGKSLKHRVIAEGVETPEQLAFLQAYGCDEGQGHYFSRPIAAHHFAKLIETGLSATV
jgi:EAL domain-containing protein (putative c-di-GMP-specific phosphodiesterase class I)